MSAVISCSISNEDHKYMVEKKISPSVLMKKAVNLIRNGGHIDTLMYENEIRRLKKALSLYVKEIDTRNDLSVLEGSPNGS